MPSFNRVILAGHLTRDPELRTIPSGTKVCGFGLAVNRSYTTSAGDKRDEVCFIDVVAWGRMGEVVHEYLQKGSGALVEGHLRLNSWEDKNGQKRSKLEVVAERVLFLGGKGAGGSGQQQSEAAGGGDDVPF